MLPIRLMIGDEAPALPNDTIWLVLIYEKVPEDGVVLPMAVPSIVPLVTATAGNSAAANGVLGEVFNAAAICAEVAGLTVASLTLSAPVVGVGAYRSPAVQVGENLNT